MERPPIVTLQRCASDPDLAEEALEFVKGYSKRGVERASRRILIHDSGLDSGYLAQGLDAFLGVI